MLNGSPEGILAAFEAADALVELLAADAMAVPVDLILSTSLRALEAAGRSFAGVLQCYGPYSSAAGELGTGLRSDTLRRLSASNSTGSASTFTAHSGVGQKSSSSAPNCTLETLASLLCSLLSVVLPALLDHHKALAVQFSRKKASKKSKRAEHTATFACAAAIDEILGAVYQHMLLPAIRAFALLSEGYLSDCFFAGTGSNHELNAADDDVSTGLPDLRSAMFTLLQEVLAVLEDTLSQAQVEPKKTSTPASPCTDTSAFAENPARIPSPYDIRTLLALECIRELGKLYLSDITSDPAEPSHCTQSSCSSTDENPGPYAGTHVRRWHAPDSCYQPYFHAATPSGPATFTKTLLSASDSASTSASIPPLSPSAPAPASRSSSSATFQQHARAQPGTLACAVRPPTCTLPDAESGPPRAARNLGETYSGARPSAPGPSSSDHGARTLRSHRASAPAVPPEHGKPQLGRGNARGRAGSARIARIAKLARKDAAWWLCAVLDRLLPSLPSLPPRAAQQDSPPPRSASSLGAARDPAGSAAPTPSSTGSESCSDVANEAVYYALVDLLRRTRPRPRFRSGLGCALAEMGVNDGCAPSSSPAPREFSPFASNHAQREEAPAPAADHPVCTLDADPEMDLDPGEKLAQKSGKAGTLGVDPYAGTRVGSRDTGAEMSEVERGMLLAVLERAWLGV
ncbi:hypothetical protein FKP32DRAFT_1756584 [Trametes sanguinea]|nr:hypothetical protein FKP32DRAFT_1756584 [Trametes sanguinea]